MFHSQKKTGGLTDADPDVETGGLYSFFRLS